MPCSLQLYPIFNFVIRVEDILPFIVIRRADKYAYLGLVRNDDF